MSEGFIHRERVSNILRFYTPDGNHSLSMNAYNGGLYLSVWARESDGKPLMSLFINRELMTMLILKAKQIDKLNESRATWIEVYRREGMGNDATSKYTGTIRIERDQDNVISLGMNSANHPEMMLFPISFSHIDSLKPDGQQMTMWVKTVIGLKTLIREFETFATSAVFHTSMHRQPQDGAGNVGAMPGPGTGTDINFG